MIGFAKESRKLADTKLDRLRSKVVMAKLMEKTGPSALSEVDQVNSEQFRELVNSESFPTTLTERRVASDRGSSKYQQGLRA